MAKELMNPLGISYKNFVVAEDVATGDRVGWAQIRSLGPAGTDPSTFDSAPGSIISTIGDDDDDDDVDDVMWEEFEDDPSADFSSWWSTLPWTKEYKAAFHAAEERRERRAQLLEQEETTRRINNKQQEPPQLWELASVYVIPERRSEGIGSDLVRSVLDQHQRQFGRGKEAVYALTLSSTVEWYRSNFGFVQVEEETETGTGTETETETGGTGGGIPKPMAFEVAVGTVITKLMGNQLVCLRLPLTFDK